MRIGGTRGMISAAAMPWLVYPRAMREAWPHAWASDRAGIRDAFRPVAEGWLADMSCDGFTGLADAGFVEKTSANVNRYLSCDDEVDSDPAPVVASNPTPTTASTSMAPTAAGQRASAGLLASHNMYTNMSNVLLQNHVGNMNAILNMGNNNYHYVYSKP
jgi:hypothetical protein